MLAISGQHSITQGIVVYLENVGRQFEQLLYFCVNYLSIYEFT